jgi:hypothetical protein
VKDWRICYLIGGGMGFALLILRISVYESGMYLKVREKTDNLGNFSILFKDKEKLIRYLSIILLAIPIWYVVQLYAKYAPELADALGLAYEDKKKVAIYAIMAVYSGLTLGDVSCGLLSNFLKSRKKAVLIYLLLLMFFILVFWIIGKWSMTIFLRNDFHAGVGNRILGGFYECRCGVFWHQYPFHRKQHCTEFCARFSYRYQPVVRFVKKQLPFLHSKRQSDGRCHLYRNRVTGMDKTA